MRARASVAIVLATAVPSCTRPAEHLAPPEGARSLLLAVEVPGAATELLAAELTPDSPAVVSSLRLAEGSRLTAIFVPHELEDLQLSPGGVLLDTAAHPRSRPMPTERLRIQRTTVAAEELEPWADLDARAPLEAALESIRFVPLDVAACFERPGCAVAGCTRCSTTCDSPPPPAAPALPAPAAPPVIGAPCPRGWTLATELDIELCHPPPITACPAGEASFVDSGCARVGSACADFRPGDGASWFVRAGETGGDGTAARPFGTIAEALARATSGATIALASGSYRESLVIDRAITLRGACPESTVIEGSVSVAEAGSAALADLSIASTATSAIRVRPGGALTVRGVLASSPADESIVVDARASLDASRLVARGAREAAISAAAGARVALDRAVISSGLIARSGSVSAVRLRLDARETPRVWVVNVQQGATLSLREAHVLGEGRGAVIAADGGELTASDLRIDTLTSPPLFSTNGGSMRVERARIEQSSREDLTAGVVVRDGGEMSLTDSVVISRPSGATPAPASAVQCEHAGKLSLARVRIFGGSHSGLWSDQGEVEIRDLIVSDVAPSDGTAVGVGILKGTAVVERVHVSGAVGTGVDIARSSATLRDITIEDTAPRPAIGSAALVVSTPPTRVRAERVKVSRATTGVFAQGQPEESVTLDASDLTIEDVATGVRASVGSSVSLDRISIQRFEQAGVLVQTNANLRATEIAVSDGPRAALEINHASARLERFDLRRVDLGIRVIEGTVELQRGRIATEGSAINLEQAPALDLCDLADGVVIESGETPIRR